MSDLHEPDLDRAFDSLASELATRPGRPGARAAIAAARKRRRTRVGAVALVTAVAAAGFALPTILGGGDDTRSGFAEGVLPEAAPLTAEALTEATAGWVGPWEALGPENVDRLTGLEGGLFAGASPSWDTDCSFPPGEEIDVDPSRLGDQLYLSDGTAVTTAAFLDLETAPVAMEAYSGLQIVMSRCLSGFEETTHDDAFLAHATSAGAGDDSADTEELWVARVGDRVGVVTVMRSTSAAPQGPVDAVGELLLAAMRDETSYETSFSAIDPSRSEVSTSESFDSGGAVPRHPRLTLARLRELTGDWSAGWQGDDFSIPRLPCVPRSWPSTAGWGSSASVGDRGELSYAGTADSTGEVADLVSRLRDCPSARWLVHPEAGDRGTAAWAEHDGGAVFVAERDGVVTSLQVRDVPPVTDEVAEALIGELERNLTRGG